jgi:hypothetical protein
VAIAAGIPSSIVNIMQDRTLERVFHDPLFANLLFRGEARPELWQANLGERQVFTRTGLIEPSTTPLVPGADPVPASYSSEQWEAEASQFGHTLDTHMPTSYVTLASKFLNDTKTLGMHAAQTMNRLIRNSLYRKYLGGETVLTVAATVGQTTIFVAGLNGFTERVVDGRLLPVSPTNPLPITFSGSAEPANTVIGFSPSNPANPLGPGQLSLGAAITATGVPIRGGVFAATRSRRVRVGNGATPDALTSGSILTLNTIISSVTRLRGQNVPPHADGYYHVHLTPEGEEQIFQDNHWQRLHQSLPDSAAYRDLAIGRAVGCIFYRNTENPNSFTVNASSILADPGGAGGATFSTDIGGELTNEAGVAIRRALVTGGGVVVEKYLDESKFITEAGVTGKIGMFSVVNGGVSIMTQRIRYILRAPLDRLQQVLSQSWSWSGDFPIPSDVVSGDGARYKRAVVIEHA